MYMRPEMSRNMYYDKIPAGLAYNITANINRIFCASSYLPMNEQVKEDEIGRACSTNGGEEECL
jgi:hypothetical protein